MYNKYNASATYSCKHKETKNPICAIPCNGQFELCEDDSDEDCQGPGLIVGLLTSLIFSILFLSSTYAISRGKISNKVINPQQCDLELEVWNTAEENPETVINVLLKLSYLRSILDIKNATSLADSCYKATYPEDVENCETDAYYLKVFGTNNFSSFFYDCVKRSLVIKVLLQLHYLVPKLHIISRRYYIAEIVLFLEGTISLSLRYSDLTKDILFLHIIWLQLGQYSEGSFPIAIFWTLFVSVVCTEVGNVIFVMSEDFYTNCLWKKVFTLFFAPFLPAYHIYKILHYELLKLHCIYSYGSPRGDQQLGVRSKQIKNVDEKLCRLKLSLSRSQCFHNVLKNIPQLTILLFIILLGNTNSRMVETLENLFVDDSIYLPYALAILSLGSVVRGQINFCKATKNGCLSGICIVTAYFLVGIVSRFEVSFYSFSLFL